MGWRPLDEELSRIRSESDEDGPGVVREGRIEIEEPTVLDDPTPSVRHAAGFVVKEEDPVLDSLGIFHRRVALAYAAGAAPSRAIHLVRRDGLKKGVGPGGAAVVYFHPLVMRADQNGTPWGPSPSTVRPSAGEVTHEVYSVDPDERRTDGPYHLQAQLDVRDRR